MSTGLLRPGLVHSAHRGRIKLLKGYVSKSSAALNPLTITQLACELSMRGRSRTALLGPSHQLAVRMRIMRIIVLRMRSAYTYRVSWVRVPPEAALFFLGKVIALGVLCCFALFVCLTLLASFFLPSHLSFVSHAYS